MFRFDFWSIAIPAAIIAGYALVVYRSKQAGLPERLMENALLWALGVGLVVSHVVEILLYQPHRLEEDGFLTLFKFWDGLSSFGGFAGGTGALIVFFAIRRQRWWREADVLIEGMVAGWIFGRLGCTVALDHPGPETEFFLGFSDGDGPLRHNMGFYEMLFTLLVLFPMNLIVHKWKPPAGILVALNCMVYGAGRFALDFGRATDVAHADPRYAGGLTLAQCLSIALFLFGTWVLFQARRGKLDQSREREKAGA